MASVEVPSNMCNDIGQLWKKGGLSASCVYYPAVNLVPPSESLLLKLFQRREEGQIEEEDEDEEDDDPALQPKRVEQDPTGRFVRFEKLLGRGAFKSVYFGLDKWECREIAWNRIDLNFLPKCGDKELSMLYREVRVLKKLKHPNIMSFYDSWMDQKNGVLNFITELFPSGTLRQYRKQHKTITSFVIKRWAWQILQGLVYLHGHSPPIVHRDLKPENIFVQGATGTVKIGDLGFSTLTQKSAEQQSVLGTPEYMAPELYEGCYDQKVDIYSYGMSLLALATSETPYRECKRFPVAVYKRVSNGIPPEALATIDDPELKDFIQLCTCYNPDFRPEARQLLKHSFFDEFRCGGSGEENKTDKMRGQVKRPSILNRQGTCKQGYKVQCFIRENSFQAEFKLSLPFKEGGGERRVVCFDFDVVEDSAQNVAEEMVAELQLDPDHVKVIAELVQSELYRESQAQYDSC